MKFKLNTLIWSLIFIIPICSASAMDSDVNNQAVLNQQNINQVPLINQPGSFVRDLGDVTFSNRTNFQLLIIFYQNDLYLSLHGAQIVLNPGAYVTLPVEAPDAKIEYKESYVQVKVLSNSNYSDFLGVESVDGKLKINGYQSLGVAMSWTKAPKLLVAFCSPNDYLTNGNTCF